MRCSFGARRGGLTLVEAMVAVGVIMLLAAITLPNFIKARANAYQKCCIENLRRIEWAKEQWAVENKKTAGTAVDVSAVNAYLKDTRAPVCPGNGVYTYNPIGRPPVCSLGAKKKGGHRL